MTDGGIYFIGAGEEARRFDVRDGMGVVLARNAGLRTAIISSRSSATVRRRAEELGIDALYEGRERKGEVLDLLLEEQALRVEEVAYLGDDLQDLPVMIRVGLPIAVADARPEVIRRALHVTSRLRRPRGGARGDRVDPGGAGRDEVGAEAVYRGRLILTAAG